MISGIEAIIQTMSDRIKKQFITTDETFLYRSSREIKHIWLNGSNLMPVA